jgi:NAD/NADP transhydrogenase beta subunit
VIAITSSPTLIAYLHVVPQCAALVIASRSAIRASDRKLEGKEVICMKIKVNVRAGAAGKLRA